MTFIYQGSFHINYYSCLTRACHPILLKSTVFMHQIHLAAYGPRAQSQFSLTLHRIPLEFRWVFHVQRNPWVWVFQVFQDCGHPVKLSTQRWRYLQCHQRAEIHTDLYQHQQGSPMNDWWRCVASCYWSTAGAATANHATGCRHWLTSGAGRRGGRQHGSRPLPRASPSRSCRWMSTSLTWQHSCRTLSETDRLCWVIEMRFYVPLATT